jgi:hypothetical protein
VSKEWRGRAGHVLGTGAPEWARQITGRMGAHPQPAGLLRADDISLDAAGQVADAVVGAVGEKRSTWRHWNLWAEASRQTMGWRFQSADDREQVIELIVAEAKARSVMVTPPDLAQLPEMFRRMDGTSRFRPRHATIFSSADLLAAEDRLLELSRLTDAPVVGVDRVARAASTEEG